MKSAVDGALPSVLVAAGFLVLYAATRVVARRFDAASYVLFAQGVEPVFWPQKLLYVYLAWLIGGVVGADRIAGTMSALSTVSAAAAVGIYLGLLRSLLSGASAAWALLGACLLGVSSTFWISASESDPYAMILAAVILATVCYLRGVDRDAAAWHVAAGLVVAAATLVHQLVVFYAVAYVLGLVFGRVRRAATHALAFVLPALGLTALVYLAIAVGHAGVRDVAGLFYWLTLDAHAGKWGVFRRDNVVEALYGLLYALVGGAGGLVPPLAVRAIALALLIAGAWLALRQLRAPTTAWERAVRALLVAWIGIYVAFIVWWYPDHTVHWQLVLVPLIALGVWTVARALPRARVALAAAAALVVLVGTLNYVRVVWPLTRPENDREGALFAQALATVPADARVVATIGMAAVGLSVRGGGDAVFQVPIRAGTRSTNAQVLAELRTYVERAWAQGRTVWVYSWLLSPPPGPVSDPVLNAEVRRLLAQLRAEGRMTVLDTRVIDRPLRRHPWDPRP